MNPGVKRPRQALEPQEALFHATTGQRTERRRGTGDDSHNRGKAAAMAEAAQMTEWLAGEDAFALRQNKQRALLRTREGRTRAVDPLVVNLLFVEQDPEEARGDGQDLMKHPNVVITDPVNYVDSLDSGILAELMASVREFVALEQHKRSRLYWQHILALCQARIEASRHPTTAVQSQVDDALRGKKTDALRELATSIEEKLELGGVDVDYWTELLHQCQLKLARAELSAMYRKVVRAAGSAGKSKDVTNETQSTKTREVDVDKAKPKTDTTFELYDQSPAALELFRFSSSVDLRGQEQPHNRPVPDHLCSRQAFESYNADPTMPAPPHVPWQSDSSLSHIHPIKPRFHNKRIRRHEWNNYNRAHYSSDRGEIPPSAVVGYEFKVFYPQLAAYAHLMKLGGGPSTPTYKVERINPTKEPDRHAALQVWDEDASPAPFRDPQSLALLGKKQANEIRGSFQPSSLPSKTAPQVPSTAHEVVQGYCLLRFTSPAPPYADVCFRIVDLPWDHSSRYQAGFRASFEDDVLSLRFKFKKVVYRT